MSWFNRRPRAQEPAKPIPHRTSPIAEKILKEAKKTAQKEAPKE